VTAFTQALIQWQKAGRQVFLLSGRANDTFTLAQFQSHTVAAGTLEISAVASSSETLVTEATPIKLSWFLNEVQPVSSDAFASGTP
jgi:hypothetical protein